MISLETLGERELSALLKAIMNDTKRLLASREKKKEIYEVLRNLMTLAGEIEDSRSIVGLSPLMERLLLEIALEKLFPEECEACGSGKKVNLWRDIPKAQNNYGEDFDMFVTATEEQYPEGLIVMRLQGGKKDGMEFYFNAPYCPWCGRYLGYGEENEGKEAE